MMTINDFFGTLAFVVLLVVCIYTVRPNKDKT